MNKQSNALRPESGLRFAALSALCALASVAASAAEIHWTGGDTLASGEPDTFGVAANWEGGIAPDITDASTRIVIDQEGAGVIWRTANASSQATYNAPVTIGSDTNPAVTVVLRPWRNQNNPSNDDPGIHYFAGGIVITGANTRVVVSKGGCLHHNGSLTLDARSSVTGEGLFKVAEKLTIPGRDYDALTLSVGRNSAVDTYALEGDAATTGPLWLTATDRGRGVDSVVTLDLCGNDLSVGAVRLGRLDWQTQAQYPGNQSGFGSVVLNGGTLSVSGDFTSLADAYGVGNDGTTGLSNQDAISTGGKGGALRIGGSFTNVATRSASGWIVEDADLVLCGDGSAVQDVEAMSRDVGDTETCCLANFCWQSLTVESGANVRLVDDSVNVSASTGPEAVYVGNLVVEAGAMLDLNGIALYYYGTATLAGTVTGGTPRKLAKTGGVMRVVTFPFEAPAATGSDGRWVGAMAAGKINGESVPTLFVNTADKGQSGTPNYLHALQLVGGTLVERANYPVNANTVLGVAGNSGTANKFLNFLVADLGDGAGANLLFNAGGYSTVGRIGADATVEQLCSDRGVVYGTAGYAVADFDRDGVSEIVAFGRGGGGCVHLLDNGAISWTANSASGGSPLSSGGVADLNGDKVPEIFAIGNGSGFGVVALTAAGGSYTSAGGTLVENLVATNSAGSQLSSGEDFGAAAAADLDGDGVPEFVFTDAKAAAGATLKVVNQEGRTLFTASGAHGSFALFDRDGDGDLEVLFGRNLYNGNGTILATLPIPAPALGFCTAVPPVLADLTGDEMPEAVYVCTTDAGGMTGRYVTAYDFVKGETVPGFPAALKAELADGVSDNLWMAGAFTYWSSSQILVADLDCDGAWEIVVGVGIYDRNNSAGSVTPATLNVVRTPYLVQTRYGQTAEETGWYSLKHGPRMDCRFPAKRRAPTILVVR